MLSDLLYRLRCLFRRAKTEEELSEELRFHYGRQVDAFLRAGLTETEARRRAAISMGGIEQLKEDCRDQRGVRPLEDLLQDVRYGLRQLRLSPGFPVVAILSLTLGIGANTAIFQLVDSIRLRMLPVRAPRELAEIHIADMSSARGSVNRQNSVTYAIWEQIRRQQQAFAGVFAWSAGELNLSPTGEVRMANSLWVSGEFFPVLGVEPQLGRLLTPADDQRGCGTPGAVIGDGFWRSEFGHDPAVIGRKISLNGRAVEIVGVTPATFYGVDTGRTFQIALPLCSISTLWFNALDAGTFWWLSAGGRLHPDWPVERAAAHLGSISGSVFASSLPSNYPKVSVKNYLAMKLTAAPAAIGVSGLRNRYLDPLWLLLSIAGLVLVIACANLANLMLARASAREREISVRLAMGASRGRLVRQLLTESFLIGIAGAALALVMSRWLSALFVALLSIGEGSVRVDLDPDWRVLGFTAALSLLATLLFGLTPALRATRSGPAAALRSTGRGITDGLRSFGLRRLLVMTQMALSLVLLVAALLFVRTLRNLTQTEMGFNPDGVLVANLGFARPNPGEVRVLKYQKALLERVRSVPGVTSVADTNVVPAIGNSWSNQVWMEGTSSEKGSDCHRAFVSMGFFRTLEMPLLAGRDFDDRDTPGSPKVAIVNQAFAQRLVGTPNPIGLHFRVEATPSTPEIELQIAGLVKNAKYRNLREEFEPVFYQPMTQDTDPNLTDQLLIRSKLPSQALLPALRRAIAEVDPNAHYEIFPYKGMIQDSLSLERMLATLSSGFGVLAGLLSAIGIYGTISYMVARRRNEIGIRMALGANRARIVAVFLREIVSMLAAGVVAGAALSLAGGSFASKFLFGLKPYDVATIAMAAGLLAFTALAATLLPAQRAANLDPMSALREE